MWWRPLHRPYPPLARLAQANERLGRAAECRRARDAYLHDYPNGIHVPNVSSLCR